MKVQAITDITLRMDIKETKLFLEVMGNIDTKLMAEILSADKESLKVEQARNILSVIYEETYSGA